MFGSFVEVHESVALVVAVHVDEDVQVHSSLKDQILTISGDVNIHGSLRPFIHDVLLSLLDAADKQHARSAYQNHERTVPR